MSKPLVIYHGGCVDGFTAAGVARRALGDIEAHPARFGEAPPNVMGRDVYILDFSYSKEVLEKMHNDAKSLLLIDHHKSAEKELSGLPYCKFAMNESGASLSWDHFFPDETRPWIIDYVRDRDIWIRQLPNTAAVSAALMSTQQDFADWDAIASRALDEVVSIGKGMRDHIERYIAAVLPAAFPVELAGHKMACVNAPYPNISDILDALVDSDTPVALGFYFMRDRWYYSLRSRGDIDVSEIARKLGGGGHAQAAGFQSGCVLLPEILKAMAMQ